MTASPRDTLIVFTRYPEPGVTKTRLIPQLGPERAAGLHAAMAHHTIARAQEAAARVGCSLEIHFEGGDEARMRQWLGPDVTCVPQGEGDLGTRMADTFERALRPGPARAVIIGTDCPGITPDLLDKTFDELNRNDLVLGPATDGGYYLIGLRRPVPRLFVRINWGTGTVLEQTVETAANLGLGVELLDPLSDVDRPDDLPVWEREAAASPARLEGERLSVVVPALNEAANLGATLDSLRGAYDVEVIVVDGGSHDATAAIAAEGGAKVVVAARGRAIQMNAGARAATGELLLFLHADTRLPMGYAHHVRRELADPDVATGAFELGIDAAGRGIRLVERATNWRSRRLQMPYGDQGLFLRASMFRRVNGFPEMPIMEDFERVRRRRRQGRIVVAPARVATSARRWESKGVLPTTLVNWGIAGAYLLGVGPDRLARWYGRDGQER